MTTPPKTSRKKAHSGSKGLHPRNIHRDGYNFEQLASVCPDLKPYIVQNIYGNSAINFADPAAVKNLNKALLKKDYNIDAWDIPDGFLCPPVPGRVDYLHYIADLLKVGDTNAAAAKIKLLDIGTGANGIYALLACKAYGWHCTASDINPTALNNVEAIVEKNKSIKGNLTLRLQSDKSHIFTGIIHDNEYFDVSVCNPPFHASLDEALKGNRKKRHNLEAKRLSASPQSSSLATLPALNFGGQNAELWCKGGEHKFLRTMIKESHIYSKHCRWFTTLVSKSDNLKPAKKLLQKLQAANIKEIEMKQGQKITRILAWSFEPIPN